jgi:hypothetical protein
MDSLARAKPHVDSYASAWLIKRFIDRDAVFGLVSKEEEIRKGAIGFTLPKAEINPIESVRTAFDALVERHRMRSLIVMKPKEIVRDYEFSEENLDRIRLKETLGVCNILKGFEKTSQTDAETVSRTIEVMVALYPTLKELND